MYYLVVFISSFLLFAIEPLFAKWILPLFGGAANVWTTLMSFYMGFTLLGYLYVLLINRLPVRIMKRIHISLIFISIIAVLFEFIIWNSSLYLLLSRIMTLSSIPIISIWFLAFISIGPPFFLLATTSTLLQAWTEHKPYSLYAISNSGSLIGLLSYPFIIEPYLSMKTQFILWGMLCIGVSLILLYITTQIYMSPNKIHISNMKEPYPKISVIFLWIFLSFLSTVSLLSTTNNIAQTISSVAFLWLIPLALYLFTFIISFNKMKAKVRIFLVFILSFMLIMHTLWTLRFIRPPVFFTISISLFTMTMLMLVLHNQLFEVRPKRQFIPFFYFCISFGGLMASIFCLYLAPMIFIDYREYFINLFMGGVFCIFLLIYYFNPSLIKGAHVKTILVITLILGIGISFASRYATLEENLIYRNRNFFGTIKIVEDPSSMRLLISGTITHGMQIFNDPNEFVPTTYYTKSSGAGFAILQHPKRILDQSSPLRIGAIGLGIGTIAGFCQKNDYFHFFEINPEIIRISDQYFTFLSHCRSIGGIVKVTEGDGRLSILNEKIQRNEDLFDVLVVDAFSGDAIPTHLLTLEAVKLYLFHIQSDGIIAFHITNALFDFTPILYKHAQALNLFAYTVTSDNSEWIIISPLPLNSPNANPIRSKYSVDGWTDNYSNLFQILKKQW